MLSMVVGCSAENDSEDKNSRTLETVLNETFTVPKEIREVEKYEVKGQANFSENGRIVGFIIRQDSNLSMDIRNN
jgi:hypothetical protein